jgi:dihydrodipicolinate synthase/N-acetylneuraminate lyase
VGEVVATSLNSPVKQLLHLPGIITVLNTPFTAGDALDLPGLRRHIAYALEAGVAGFLIPAMASEVGKLTDYERDALIATTVEAVGGRVPIIGGASANSVDRSAELAGRCIALGCQGVLVSIPYANASDYTAWAHAVADLQPGFLMIQDWSQDGYGVPVDLVVRLFEEIPAFRCLKVEVVPAGVKYSEVLAATGGRLHVSGGWAVTQMVEALDRGVHAFMPTGLHHSYCEIVRRYHAGDRAGAQALHEQLLPILAFSNQHLDISIHFFKRLLHAQGIYETPHVRLPILPFDSTHQRVAAALIERAMKLEQVHQSETGGPPSPAAG